MKLTYIFVLGCLLAVQVYTQEVGELTEEEMDVFLDECLTDGLAEAKRLQSLAIAKPFIGCEDEACIAFKSAHAFKIASFGANSRSLCQGQGMLQASLFAKNRLGLPIETVIATLSEIDLSEDSCKKIFASCIGIGYLPRGEVSMINDVDGTSIPVCANSRFREIDGFCNNLRTLELGTTTRAFSRLLQPEYNDGLSEPRMFQSNGMPLPNPRNVSRLLSGVPPGIVDQTVTQMVKVWGQFLDHDITRTPEGSAGMAETGETLLLECCEEDELVVSEFISPECTPIRILEDDEFFTSREVECLPFVRSTPADAGCVMGPRQQFNDVTSFIDGSNVYGSTAEEEKDLRNWVRGNLAHTINGETEVGSCEPNIPLVFLPPGDNDPEANFRAGDIRVNEQPSLAATHTVWMRIHNRIADLIYGTTAFEDETTFQEARRIVIALMQHFTYNDFLPLVIGRRTMASMGLYSLPGGLYSSGYSPSTDPTISNVFGTAAFRFGHTLITNNMSGFDPFFLGDEFFRAATLFENVNTQPSSIMEMEARMPGEQTDVLLDVVLTTRLALGPPPEGEAEFPDHGNDLMALNIMRGRDHGLKGYNAWRKFCGLRRIPNFTMLENFMDPETARVLSSLYESVDDIDLFPAALAENPLAGGGILGPTFSCLIGLQFKALKYGDRYFYENGPFVHSNNPDISFTPSQLALIKGTSFGELLCEVTCTDSYPFDVFRFRPEQGEFNCAVRRSALFVALEADEWFC